MRLLNTLQRILIKKYKISVHIFTNGNPGNTLADQAVSEMSYPETEIINQWRFQL